MNMTGGLGGTTENNNDDDYWQCGSCKIKVTEDSDVKVLPIALGGDGLKNQGLTLFVCPNCYTLQLPEEVFKEFHKRMQSNIIP